MELEARLKALMLRGLDGDAAAYRELLSQLSRMLRGYFARRLHVEAEVEDLVQDCLLAVHTRRATYDRAQPFTAWAHAVARYKLIDHYRRQRVRVHVPVEEAAELLFADPRDATAAPDLARMLDVLPERQRRLVMDVKIEGLSLAEAGARGGLSPGVAKVSLHRAMKLLTARARDLED